MLVCQMSNPHLRHLEEETTVAVATAPTASWLLCASFAALVRLNEDEFGLKLTGDSDTEALRQGLSRGVHNALRGE
jgi:hypothetical protein